MINYTIITCEKTDADATRRNLRAFSWGKGMRMPH